MERALILPFDEDDGDDDDGVVGDGDGNVDNDDFGGDYDFERCSDPAL